jgi:hypothetical protein
MNYMLSKLQSAEATADALRQRMAWKPIGTAPTDGSPILGWQSNGAVVCWWVPEWEWWEMTRRGATMLAKPSHWMPLPEPPQDADAVARGPRDSTS